MKMETHFCCVVVFVLYMPRFFVFFSDADDCEDRRRLRSFDFMNECLCWQTKVLSFELVVISKRGNGR